jgi:hypothetical protein
MSMPGVDYNPYPLGPGDLAISDLKEPDKTKWRLIPKFKCAFPKKKFPEVWVNGRPATNEPKTVADAIKLLEEQYEEYNENLAKINNPEQETVLWNPSDKIGENSAVAINYKSHGGLTKVFLKPTIPFQIGYDALPPIAQTASPAPAPK